MIKTITIALTAVLALSISLTAAQGAHHGKKKPHKTARSVNAPTSAGLDSRRASSSCRTIPGMSSNNRFGVDNDLNVYRDKPQCN
jgi:hypothetical protein